MIQLNKVLFTNKNENVGLYYLKVGNAVKKVIIE